MGMIQIRESFDKNTFVANAEGWTFCHDSWKIKNMDQ